VQIGFDQNASLLSRCLLRERYTLMASPEYLERRGTPRTLEDLTKHDCIVAVRANGVREPWPLADGGTLTIERPRFAANSAGLGRIAALQGLGIGLMAHSLVRDDLADGALVPVLDGQVGQLLPVSLVYPAGSKLSPKIRCFVEYAAAWVARLGGDAPADRATVLAAQEAAEAAAAAAVAASASQSGLVSGLASGLPDVLADVLAEGDDPDNPDDDEDDPTAEAYPHG
jgi:hypothetical protein